jgi:hypothetical protein
VRPAWFYFAPTRRADVIVARRFDGSPAVFYNCRAPGRVVDPHLSALGVDSGFHRAFAWVEPLAGQKWKAGCHLSDANPREPSDLLTAEEFWATDPIAALEAFRNHVIDAMEIVITIHQSAELASHRIEQAFHTEFPNYKTTPFASAERQSLSAKLRERQKEILLCSLRNDLTPLLNHEYECALVLWKLTPLARYLTKTTPVHLDRECEQTSSSFSASCHHELGILLVNNCIALLKSDACAHDYCRTMRFYTAAGNRVTRYLRSWLANVPCECKEAIEQLRTELIAATPEAAAADKAEPTTPAEAVNWKGKTKKSTADGVAEQIVDAVATKLATKMPKGKLKGNRGGQQRYDSKEDRRTFDRCATMLNHGTKLQQAAQELGMSLRDLNRLRGRVRWRQRKNPRSKSLVNR